MFASDKSPKHKGPSNQTTSSNRNGDAIDFLPAALEILERPPSPIGRWLGYALIVLFSIAIAWACIGKVDVVATAEGKIIPGGRVKLIQPLQLGVINQIHVKEGQLVEQGEALVELDQTLTNANRQKIENDIYYIQTALARENVLNALYKQEASSRAETQAPVDDKTIHELFSEETKSEIELTHSETNHQIALTHQQWLSYQDTLKITQSRIESKRGEKEAALANIQRYESTIPLITKRVEALKNLHSQGLGAEAQLLELQEQQVSQQQALIAERANVKRIASELVELNQTAAAQANAARLENLQTIETLTQQLLSAKQELNKATELDGKQILISPVKGRVKQLAVHTIGGVVEEAKVIMQIVPEEDYLEVEAVLQNKDIGFVHKGQIAEIKVHTFPFTKYGVVDAEVLDITADAIESEQLGLVYNVRLKLKENKLWVERDWMELIPGMSVTAEVKTNKRRLIEFFMSPLLRYRDESVRER